MTVEKKTIRSDIPGHNGYLGGLSQDDARRLVIGRGISLKGSVSDCDHLVVEGRMEGENLSCRRMEVADQGRFTGSATVEEIIISGHVDARLTVTGRLILRCSARLTGQVSYGSLEAEPGALIEGEMLPLKKPVKQPVAEDKKAAVSVVAPSNVEPLFDDEDDGDLQNQPKVYRRAAGFK